LDRRKIADETRAFRQQHAVLKGQYLGKYIAMHKGQVIDHDVDFQALFARVRAKHGRTAVMITLVEESAEPVLTRRGFRAATN
jgi:hypothetical protein